MFVDTAKVKLQAGKGGDGAVSFRHEIYIPKGVTKIEKGAFKNCLSLKEVIYEGNLNNLIIEEDNNYLKAILFGEN